MFGSQSKVTFVEELKNFNKNVVENFTMEKMMSDPFNKALSRNNNNNNSSNMHNS